MGPRGEAEIGDQAVCPSRASKLTRHPAERLKLPDYPIGAMDRSTFYDYIVEHVILELTTRDLRTSRVPMRRRP